jgi:hypothetical protein
LKAQASQRDDDPRGGAWKLNVAKSTFHDGPPPRSELQTCEALNRDTIRLKIVGVDASGKEIRSEYTTHYDGKDHPFPGSLWDTIVLKRLDRNTSEAVFKKSGNTVQTSTVSVSKDGQVLTFTAKGTGVPGQPISHIEVFDRRNFQGQRAPDLNDELRFNGVARKTDAVEKLLCGVAELLNSWSRPLE